MALRTPAFNDAKSYGFEWLRAVLEAGLQEGVLGAGDLKVTAAGAGGMRVDVAAGQAVVKGDSGIAGTGLSQGLFLVVNDAAIASAVTLTNSDPTNPRLDQIVLRVRDSADLGSGADDAVLEVVTGAPTAGATLDNRNGAAALPADRIRLADVLVPATSAAVTAGNVRDRRPWARGAYRRIVRNLNAGGTQNYTTASNTDALIDSVNLQPRIECVGNPVRVTLVGVFTPGAANERVVLKVWVDGAGVDGGLQTQTTGPVSGSGDTALSVFPIVPAAGSHLLGVAWHQEAVAGTDTLLVSATIPVVLEVEEIVRQNADNT